jgi:hypothetical protein
VLGETNESETKRRPDDTAVQVRPPSVVSRNSPPRVAMKPRAAVRKSIATAAAWSTAWALGADTSPVIVRAGAMWLSSKCEPQPARIGAQARRRIERLVP